jgi:hypothetical protein
LIAAVRFPFQLHGLIADPRCQRHRVNAQRQ